MIKTIASTDRENRETGDAQDPPLAVCLGQESASASENASKIPLDPFQDRHEPFGLGR